MKKSILILLIAAGAYMVQSCDSPNKGADDTVEHAMDENEEMLDQRGDTANLEGDDTDFAVKAANSGLAEVQAGEIAQQKAQDQRVKDYAKMMVQDHSKANEELKALAASKNITLPTAPGEDHLKSISNLNEKTGAEFDKEYMSMMVNDHQEAVDLFEGAAEDSDDAEIRAFAAQKLPALKKHLEEAQALEESLD
jgi:putative membrane protein